MTWRILLFVVGVSLAFTYLTAVPARADRGEPLAVQALVGAAKFEDGGLTITSPANDPSLATESDLSQLPLLGVVGHLPFGEGSGFGLEGGLLFGWRSRDVSAFSTLTTTHVRVETRLTLLDLFLGLYASRQLGRSTRLFVGAGPALLFVDVDGERTEDDGSGTVTVIDTGESAFGIGGYARAGIEFRLRDGGMMGICLRAVAADLDFDRTVDRNLDGLQGFVSYSRGFDF